MANNVMTVFSEFEARSMRFIFGEGDVYDVKCVGKIECEALRIAEEASRRSAPVRQAKALSR